MYCTTPSGTRYQTGSPSRTRSRQAVDEIAIAGTSSTLTPSSGRPVVDRSCPGLVTPTKWASDHSSSASFHDSSCPRASAPVMNAINFYMNRKYGRPFERYATPREKIREEVPFDWSVVNRPVPDLPVYGYGAGAN